MTCLQEFSFYNSKVASSVTRRPRGVQWSAPPVVMVKVNVDGAFHHFTRKGGISFVIRNSDGHMIASGGRPLSGLVSAEHAELLACKMAVEFLVHHDFRPAVLEKDALVVQRQLVSCNGNNTSLLGRLYDDLTESLAVHTDIAVTSMGRQANKVAHSLAAHACSENQDFFLFFHTFFSSSCYCS
ncbi:uncharacterized protein LOC112199714 [Rosa chinensis]|uniref:uncharacterized protein LOC112199714 n=1 Tax=Rosa chinensis TaxID=74649 RepID=UPI000D0898E3|nr:uncharacterized protein LOC112199714 [Rosa chinensis]